MGDRLEKKYLIPLGIPHFETLQVPGDKLSIAKQELFEGKPSVTRQSA